ncbi:hypothetical protein ACP4OV_003838 [Aristida adscensionis]
MDSGVGIMRRMHVVVVCAAVGALGFVTVILGVAGEAATAKALKVGASVDGDNCAYRATAALGCGVVAALLALTAQVLVTAAALCCGCCRKWELPTQARHIAGIAVSAVSWILTIIVVVLFIVGAAMNDDHERQPTDDDEICILAPGNEEFAAATALSLAATCLQIASYILLQATAADSKKQPLSSPPPPPPEVPTGLPEQQQAADNGAAAAAGGDLPPTAPPAFPEATSEHANQV